MKETKKIVKVKFDKETKEYYFSMDDFADIIDTSKAVKYKLSKDRQGVFSVKFYDKRNRLVKPKCK